VLIDHLNRVTDMQALAANPLLLSIICYVVMTRCVTLPATRAELYERALTKLLNGDRAFWSTMQVVLALSQKRRILERSAFGSVCEAGPERHTTFDERASAPEAYRGGRVRGLTNAASVPLACCRTSRSHGILRGNHERGYFFLHLTSGVSTRMPLWPTTRTAPGAG